MPYSFRISAIPLLATLAVCALGLSLGQWQTRRAAEKEEIAVAMQKRAQLPALEIDRRGDLAADLAFRRVTLTGEFVRSWPLYLDNRPMHGVAGFYVLMPFKIHGSDQHVLVQRGWQPRNPANRTQMPLLKTPDGQIRLEGLARSGVERVMQLGQPVRMTPGAILQNLDLSVASGQTGLKMLDFVLQQTSETSDGLQRAWPLPSAGADKHRAYAFQWYGLALMAVIFFGVTGFRRGKNR